MKIKIRIYLYFFLIILFNGCSEKQPKEIKKIILFGDSLMSGYGLSSEEHLDKILQKDLNLSGYKIIIINKSVSGDTSSDGLARLDKILKIEDADLIILGLGANDMLKGIDPSITKKNLQEIQKFDGVIFVVRAFNDESIPHPYGEVNFLNDVEQFVIESRLIDVQIIEKRISNLSNYDKSLNKQDKENIDKKIDKLI